MDFVYLMTLKQTLMKKEQKSYLEFTVDYDGEVEDVFVCDIEGKDITDDVEWGDLDNFVQRLLELDGFFLSDNRTEIRVRWYNNDTMDIHFRDYTEPDWGKFNDHKLNDVPSFEIDFNQTINWYEQVY